MNDSTKPPEQAKFKWVEPKEPPPELYTNLIHASWNLYDVSLILGQLKVITPGDPSAGFVVETQGTVTMAWPQAKALRDMLSTLVSNFESVNGEIRPLKLPPASDRTK
jgi:Protein of unknown function (DUF3467)